MRSPGLEVKSVRCGMINVKFRVFCCGLVVKTQQFSDPVAMIEGLQSQLQMQLLQHRRPAKLKFWQLAGSCRAQVDSARDHRLKLAFRFCSFQIGSDLCPQYENQARVPGARHALASRTQTCRVRCIARPYRETGASGANCSPHASSRSGHQLGKLENLGLKLS